MPVRGSSGDGEWGYAHRCTCHDRYICIIALFSTVANLNQIRCMPNEFKDIYIIHSFSCGPFMHVGNYFTTWTICSAIEKNQVGYLLDSLF